MFAEIYGEKKDYFDENIEKIQIYLNWTEVKHKELLDTFMFEETKSEITIESVDSIADKKEKQKQQDKFNETKLLGVFAKFFTDLNTVCSDFDQSNDEIKVLEMMKKK